MATRAGAGTGMLVSLVVFVVATVALLVVSIVLFTGKSKAEDAEKAAQATLAQVITTEERNRDAVRAMLGDATSNRQSLYAAMAQQASDVATFVAGNPGASLAECCFAPKSATAAEGEGYLVGVVTRQNEGGRTDFVILDAQRLADGPLATVKLPVRNPGQVHGWWVREDQLPQA